MTRERLPLQQDLVSDVWRISHTREDVEVLLEHLIRLQSQAIALASGYGATQTELAILAKVSRQRIGQIVDETDVSSLQPSTLQRMIDRATEWPQDTMKDLLTLRNPIGVDDPDQRAVHHRQVAVVYGEDEAEHRDQLRATFLASLPANPGRLAELEATRERARRRIFGDQV